MNKYKDRNERDKAFIGAIVGAASGLIGGILGAKKAKKQAAAQAQAAKIQAINQQNAINQQMANAQGQIDANYAQQKAQVEMQEKLNREQNDLAAQKIGIQDAQSLSQAYTNQDDLNNEFRNRFARCGGKFRTKAEEGGKFGWNDVSGVISGLGSVVNGAMTPSVTPTAYKLNYNQRLSYHSPVVADLEVDKTIGNKFTGKQVGQNTATYINPTTVVNPSTQNMNQVRFKCGGRKRYKNRYQ